MSFYLFMCLWTAASLAVITVAAVLDTHAPTEPAVSLEVPGDGPSLVRSRVSTALTTLTPTTNPTTDRSNPA